MCVVFFSFCSFSHLLTFWQVVVTQLQQMKVNILLKANNNLGAFTIWMLTMIYQQV